MKNKTKTLQKAIKKMQSGKGNKVTYKEIGVCLEALYLVGQCLTQKNKRRETSCEHCKH